MRPPEAAVVHNSGWLSCLERIVGEVFPFTPSVRNSIFECEQEQQNIRSWLKWLRKPHEGRNPWEGTWTVGTISLAMWFTNIRNTRNGEFSPKQVYFHPVSYLRIICNLGGKKYWKSVFSSFQHWPESPRWLLSLGWGPLNLHFWEVPLRFDVSGPRPQFENQ